MRRHSLTFVKGAFSGVFTGAALCLVLLYALNATGVVILAVPALPGFTALFNTVYANLQESLLFFLAVLLLYVVKLRELRRQLAAAQPDLQRVISAENATDLCANLFFGIGVIWTAIGMRGALVSALSHPVAAAAEGAFAILQRLVDGGILLALSTTIFGGIGGYLMRAWKTLALGGALQAFYLQESRRQGEDIHAALLRIEARIAAPAPEPESSAAATTHTQLQDSR